MLHCIKRYANDWLMFSDQRKRRNNVVKDYENRYGTLDVGATQVMPDTSVQ